MLRCAHPHRPPRTAARSARSAGAYAPGTKAHIRADWTGQLTTSYVDYGLVSGGYGRRAVARASPARAAVPRDGGRREHRTRGAV